MKDRSFRGPFTSVFEDFHPPYYRTDMEANCLKRRPFKGLDFTAALHEIQLTQEFYEQAESNFQKKNTKINLRFEVGTSKLIQDSLNTKEQEKFVKEISSYGNSLVELTIVGGASPDGSMKHNEELARQRANVARGMLGRIAITPRITTQVYTWTDVANTLRELC
jgi:outer membrane protein OmpA-like peptidoglycan-associated protein